MSYISTPTHISLRLASRRYYALSSQVPLITQLWFSPYLEDRKTFMSVCDHPFLGEHVTALTYDITRFEDFSFEELRKFWPRPWRFTAENRPLYLRGKEDWLENHPGPWQYLEVVKEAKSSAFDEYRTLTEVLRKLPSVKTVRLAFAFQKGWLVNRVERLSPLRMYSDIEWVSRQRDPTWVATITDEQMGKFLSAITKSGAYIEELDLWQDYITVPLSAFKFKTRFNELSVIFSRLTRLSIRIPESSIKNEKDITAFQKLLALATKLRQFNLCINHRAHWSVDYNMDLVGHTALARMQIIECTDRPFLRSTSTAYDDPRWPGTVWIYENPDLCLAT
ncbi:hypothetical protein O988_03928 [Pseudogymnoascus sp. VKM F-3808]|nr:hypothetical protein O988_03928 [Pseudogymnoascus sp. VKM F-3808]